MEEIQRDYSPRSISNDETFRILVEAVRDYGIFLLDPEGYIRSWNLGAERIEGYSANEVIGKHFSIFYTSEDIQRKHPQKELEIAMKAGRYEEEGWRIRKNGARFWSSVVITTLKSKAGVHIGFAKVTRDLSERKEAEERLRLSEERARRIFEGVKDYAMITLDPEGKVVTWNEGARRIKGYEANEIIGKHFSIFYPEQDVQMGKCDYELKEASETGRFEDENWRIRKDGTRFWASVVITAIRNNKGKVLGYSKVTRDMTDRKRADDLLKMAYNNLETRIKKRTEELSETNARLIEAVHARDEFLSIASHELRTPLTPLKIQIQSFISNVRRKTLSQMSEERLERMAEACEKSVSRLASLVNNLLDISRIETGKLVLSREIFDLTEMAHELIERYQSEISTSGSQVVFQPTGPVSGDYDRLRLEQVFVNLLTNALKYGNGKAIQITVVSKDNLNIIQVRDFGIGIDKHDHGRIFERFERIQLADSVGGLGLGLYITRQIVEAHNGTITIESALDQGSTFTVTLPVHAPATN